MLLGYAVEVRRASRSAIARRRNALFREDQCCSSQVMSAGSSRPGQDELHEECPRHRIVPIGRDLPKPQRAVESLRLEHGWQRVQPHTGIPSGARTGKNGLTQSHAQALPSSSRPDIEPLDLPHVWRLQRPQGDAPEDLPHNLRSEQRASRRHVGSGKTGEFNVETLESEINPQRSRVLAEQVPDGRQICCRSNWTYGHKVYCSNRLTDRQ